jgi:hypothetical protein
VRIPPALPPPRGTKNPPPPPPPHTRPLSLHSPIPPPHRFTSYQASQICPADFPCDGGYDFATRTDKPFFCGRRNSTEKAVPCGPAQSAIDFSQSIKIIISLSVAALAACLI